MNYNKGPDHGDQMVSTEEALKYWNFKGAKESVRKMVAVYGEPSSISICDACWDHIPGFAKVWVKDESIPHDFPAPHQDCLYSARQIAVPPDLYTDFAKVTGSIIIDGQKGLVIARCQMLVKNAVTLGFVEDVVSGSAKATPEEYARRIEGNETPAWFEDRMGETLEESIDEGKKFAGWIAIHGGKKLEIKKSEAKDLYAAKQLAIKKLKVPKSKVGLMAIDVAYESSTINEGKKRYREKHGIGKAKYTVSFHDGKKKHKDGSDFFDIKIFKNKKALNDFIEELKKDGYSEQHGYK